jgi:purine-nucleoside phosphorylase
MGFMITNAQYYESAEFLRKALNGFEPEILLTLGSGLGLLADELDSPVYIPYPTIPHFKISSAPGHKGRLAAGYLAGRKVLIMQGRFHVYEGYTPEETAFPIRTANLLGIKTFITTCAAGGVNTAYKPGDLALITDTINIAIPGALTGFDITDFNQRFIDMSYTFNRQYRDLAQSIARESGFNLQEGVYFYMPGPQFESPAEIRTIRALGGDLVGMSCVHEVVMARRCGMEVLGIALVSNMAAGVSDQPITIDEVLEEGAKAAKRLSELVTSFIKRVAI